MWQALGIASILVLMSAVIGVIVGLIIGIARKRWRVLKWSAVICGIAFVLLMVAVAGDGGFEESDGSRASASMRPLSEIG